MFFGKSGRLTHSSLCLKTGQKQSSLRTARTPYCSDRTDLSRTASSHSTLFQPPLPVNNVDQWLDRAANGLTSLPQLCSI